MEAKQKKKYHLNQDKIKKHRFIMLNGHKMDLDTGKNYSYHHHHNDNNNNNVGEEKDVKNNIIAEITNKIEISSLSHNHLNFFHYLCVLEEGTIIGRMLDAYMIEAHLTNQDFKEFEKKVNKVDTVIEYNKRMDEGTRLPSREEKQSLAQIEKEFFLKATTYNNIHEFNSNNNNKNDNEFRKKARRSKIQRTVHAPKVSNFDNDLVIGSAAFRSSCCEKTCAIDTKIKFFISFLFEKLIVLEEENVIHNKMDDIKSFVSFIHNNDVFYMKLYKINNCITIFNFTYIFKNILNYFNPHHNIIYIHIYTIIIK